MHEHAPYRWNWSGTVCPFSIKYQQCITCITFEGLSNQCLSWQVKLKVKFGAYVGSGLMNFFTAGIFFPRFIDIHYVGVSHTTIGSGYLITHLREFIKKKYKTKDKTSLQCMSCHHVGIQKLKCHHYIGWPSCGDWLHNKRQLLIDQCNNEILLFGTPSIILELFFC